MTAGRVGWFVAGAYVAVVAALTADAFRPSGDGFSVTEGIAAALTVPMIVPALPLIYVVGALAWDVFGNGEGSTTPLGVTITFTALMTFVAGANVALIRLLATSVRRRQARMKSRTTRPSSVPASSWRK